MISGAESHVMLEDLEQSIMKWLDRGDVKNLERIVLLGFGDLLLGLIDHTKHRASIKFLRMLPQYQLKIDAIHQAVERHDLQALKSLVTKHKLALARDRVGTTVLHKAVLSNDYSIIVWLLNKFPRIIDAQDHNKRTALHYAAVLRSDNSDKIYQFLVNAGANIHAEDRNPNLLDKMILRCFCRKRNQSLTQHFSYLLSLWLREGKVMKLAQLVFSGCGDVLVGRQSSHPASQAFLQEVSTLLEKIHNIHSAIKDGDQKTVESLITAKKWAIARNQQGSTPLHTAVNTGQLEILKHILGKFPEAINAKDYKLRTPLHYAAGRGMDDPCYKFLIENGADTEMKDCDGHRADYYIEHADRLGFTISRDFSFDVLDNSDASSLESDDNLEIMTENGNQSRLEYSHLDFGEYHNEDTVTPLLDYKLKIAQNLPISPELQNVLQMVGKPLIEALVDVAIQRPLHPISYIASVLKGYSTK